MVALLVIAPFVVYPFFLMQALCSALFACAFNLLLGYVSLLSFGHALFLGPASYVGAHAAKVWGWRRKLGDLARRRRLRRARPRDRRPGDPQPGHLFRHDHVSPVADGVSSSASRLPSPMARTASRRCRRASRSGSSISAIRGRFTSSSPRSSSFGFLAVYRIVNSPFGEILKAIRENEPRAVSLGYRALQLQARRLRALGRPGRTCRRDEGHRGPERIADRRSF